MISYKALITEYIVNEYCRQEEDLKQAESAIRWGNYCSHDVAHLQLLRCRFECFKEFSNNVMILCRVTDTGVDDFVTSVRKEIIKKENRKGNE